MENKLLTAQYVIPNAGVSFGCGFNQRVFGDSYSDTLDSYDAGPRSAGWQHAEKMIHDGKIYYTHIFPHGWPDGTKCRDLSFSYGGTQVCNTCNRDHLDKNWWKIKVIKDGDAWMVAGEGFINLQESDNYAFGETKEDALQKYQDLMEKQNDR